VTKPNGDEISTDLPVSKILESFWYRVSIPVAYNPTCSTNFAAQDLSNSTSCNELFEFQCRRCACGRDVCVSLSLSSKAGQDDKGYRSNLLPSLFRDLVSSQVQIQARIHYHYQDKLNIPASQQPPSLHPLSKLSPFPSPFQHSRREATQPARPFHPSNWTSQSQNAYQPL